MKRTISLLIILLISLASFAQPYFSKGLVSGGDIKVVNGAAFVLNDSTVVAVMSGTLANTVWVTNELQQHKADSAEFADTSNVANTALSIDGVTYIMPDTLANKAYVDKFIGEVFETGAKDIYVSEENGSDETGDGSQGNPYATLDYTLDLFASFFINATYNIYVDSGAYAINQYHYFNAYNSELTIQGDRDTVKTVTGVTTDPLDRHHLTLTGETFITADTLLNMFVEKNATNWFPIQKSGANEIWVSTNAATSFTAIVKPVTTINIPTVSGFNIDFEGPGSKLNYYVLNVNLTGTANYNNSTRQTWKGINVFTDASQSDGIYASGNLLPSNSAIIVQNPTGTGIDLRENYSGTNCWSNTFIRGTGTRQGIGIDLNTEYWHSGTSIHMRNLERGFSVSSNGGFAELVNITSNSRFTDMVYMLTPYYGSTYFRRIDGGTPIHLDNVDYAVYNRTPTIVSNTMIYLPDGVFEGDAPNIAYTNYTKSIEIEKNTYVNIQGLPLITNVDTLNLAQQLTYRDSLITEMYSGVIPNETRVQSLINAASPWVNETPDSIYTDQFTVIDDSASIAGAHLSMKNENYTGYDYFTLDKPLWINNSTTAIGIHNDAFNWTMDARDWWGATVSVIEIQDNTIDEGFGIYDYGSNASFNAISAQSREGRAINAQTTNGYGVYSTVGQDGTAGYFHYSHYNANNSPIVQIEMGQGSAAQTFGGDFLLMNSSQSHTSGSWAGSFLRIDDQVSNTNNTSKFIQGSVHGEKMFEVNPRAAVNDTGYIFNTQNLLTTGLRASFLNDNANPINFEADGSINIPTGAEFKVNGTPIGGGGGSSVGASGDIQMSDGASGFANSNSLSTGSAFSWDGTDFWATDATGNSYVQWNLDATPIFNWYGSDGTNDHQIFLRSGEINTYSNHSTNGGWTFEIEDRSRINAGLKFNAYDLVNDNSVSLQMLTEEKRNFEFTMQGATVATKDAFGMEVDSFYVLLDNTLQFFISNDSVWTNLPLKGNHGISGGGTPSGLTGDLQLNNGGAFGTAGDMITDWRFFYNDFGGGSGEWFWGNYNTWADYLEWEHGNGGFFDLYHENSGNSGYYELYMDEGSASLNSFDQNGDGGVYLIDNSFMRMRYLNGTFGNNDLYLNSNGVYLNDVTRANNWTEKYFVTKGFTDTSYTSPTYVEDRYMPKSSPFELLDSASFTGAFTIGVWSNNNGKVFAAHQAPGLISYSVSQDGMVTPLDTLDIGSPRGVHGNDDYIFVANGSFGVYSLSYDANGELTQVDTDDQGGTYYYTFWDGNYLYAVNGTALLSYSVDGSGNLTFIESETVTQASYLYADGTYIYVTGTAGIYCFSVNGSGQLTQEDFVSYVGDLRYIWVDDTLIFTTTPYLTDYINIYENDGTGQLSLLEQIPSQQAGEYWGIWGNKYYLYVNAAGSIERYRRESDGTYTFLELNTQIDNGREITGDSDFLYLAAWSDGLASFSADLPPIKVQGRTVLFSDAELINPDWQTQSDSADYLATQGWVEKHGYYTGSLTDGAPTNTELVSILGTAASRGAGFKANVKDSDGTGLVYYVVCDGTNYYYFTGTQAL